jgi:hypothetical protein
MFCGCFAKGLLIVWGLNFSGLGKHQRFSRIFPEPMGSPPDRGPEGPAPEFVSLSDIKGMLVLCEELLKDDLPWEDPWSERRKQLLSYLEEGKDLLAFS